MPSFLEKLKKGMGVESKTDEQIQEPEPPKVQPIKKPNPAKAGRRLKMRTSSSSPEPVKPPQELKIEPEPAQKIEIEGLNKPAFAKATAGKEEWFEEPAGQLAIDVFQTEQNLIIQTAIAGIKPGNLEVTIERDIVSIRGIRQKPLEEDGDYFTKECYWGPFAREVIVPVEIDPDRVEAIMQEGILTVRMTKILRDKKRTITVKA
ncbi:MAG: Hsp20 family protein [Candidatus Nealsonbacteria bacterium]|nr:Hsp20 family protein [Candidatus Nealsonbacteria bacterium]